MKQLQTSASRRRVFVSKDPRLLCTTVAAASSSFFLLWCVASFYWLLIVPLSGAVLALLTLVHAFHPSLRY
jgi:hypothetical protein